MIKPSYLVLSALNAGCGILVSLMIVKFFGASADADVYLMCLAIIAALQLIQLLMIDQFLYFYLEKKLEGAKSARIFYTTVFSQTLIVGVFFTLVGLISFDLVQFLFASGLDVPRRGKLEEVYGVLILTAAIFPANYVNQRLFNAEEKFAYPYLLDLLIPLSSLTAFCWFLFSDTVNLMVLCYARLLGVSASFFIGCFTLFRQGYYCKFSLTSRVGLACYKNSFSMRFGHNLHNFLFSPITNSFLSLLPVGSASMYYYAERLAQLPNMIVAGPLQRVYQVRISVAWLSSSKEEIFHLMRKFFLAVLALFVASSCALYILLPEIFSFFLSEKFSLENVAMLQAVYALMAVWIGIIAIEFTFVAIGLTEKKSRLFIQTNILYITLYAAICFVLQDYFGLLAIPLAAGLAQVVSFVIFVSVVVGLMRRRSSST